ncbi:MAG: lipid asymmetry maintenance ABC transporter permease subunit MlaE [Geothermobacteraceae bacterium]
MSRVGRIGALVAEGVREHVYLAGLFWSLVRVALKPRTWGRTVRAELVRQIYVCGVQASRFVLYVAVAVGLSVVAQALLWLQRIGQPDLLGPLLVAVLVREAAPVLTNLLAISRNGTTMTVGLGQMRLSGEVRVLDAQGVDPLVYLVLPRVLGLIIAVFCLNMLFLAAAMGSGFLFSALLSDSLGDPARFTQSVLTSVSSVDLANFLVKTLVPALLTGIVCCHEGLKVQGSASRVLSASRRALAQAVRALFLVSALMSLWTYL